MAHKKFTVGKLLAAIEAARNNGLTNEHEVVIKLPTTFAIDNGKIEANQESIVSAIGGHSNFDGWDNEIGRFVVLVDAVEVACRVSDTTGVIPTKLDTD